MAKLKITSARATTIIKELVTQALDGYNCTPNGSDILEFLELKGVVRYSCLSAKEAGESNHPEVGHAGDYAYKLARKYSMEEKP